MAKSTDIKVKLSSVDEVKQFVDVIRGYHGDVDISATNKNYMVDAKSILGNISTSMWMRICICNTTMCCPSRVSDTAG